MDAMSISISNAQSYNQEIGHMHVSYWPDFHAITLSIEGEGDTWYIIKAVSFYKNLDLPTDLYFLEFTLGFLKVESTPFKKIWGLKP